MQQLALKLGQLVLSSMNGRKRDLNSNETASTTISSNSSSVLSMKGYGSELTTTGGGIDLKAILIAFGVGFGVLVLVAVIWTVMKCRREGKGKKKMGDLEVAERKFEELRGEWERISL
ncbi:hypothetical protein B0J14DRAFT_566528 [Halenospora varia]|nr:hypothetical protein B0J14DRAFT_566528 [Halenospora varia]